MVVAGDKTVTRRIASINPGSPWSTSGCRLQTGAGVYGASSIAKPAATHQHAVHLTGKTRHDRPSVCRGAEGTPRSLPAG